MPRLGIRKESEHTCKYCGKTYMTSVASYVCPDCREDHKRAYARERRRRERLRTEQNRQQVQRKKKKRPMEDLEQMARQATAAGLTYGQLQARRITGGEGI